MADNEAGAFLNITPDVLKKLESFDTKLENIQNHAKTAADALKNGFSSVVVDTSKLESAISALTAKIGALGTAGASVQNIGTAMNNTAQSTQQVATATSSATQSLSGMAQIANQLSVSGPFESWNIARLKSEIDNLNSSLKSGKIDLGSGERDITKQEQQAIVDKRNALQEELKIQESSTAAKMSTLAKVRNAQNADAIAQQKMDEAALQSHLKMMEERSKREKQLSDEALKYGTERLEAEKKAIISAEAAKRNAENARLKNYDTSAKQYESEQKSAKATEDANRRKMASDLSWYEQRAKQRENDLRLEEEARRREIVASANAKAKSQPTTTDSDNEAMKRVDAARKTEEAVNKERQKGVEAAIKQEKQETSIAEQQAKVRLEAEKAVNKDIEKERKAYLDRLNREAKIAQQNQISQQRIAEQQAKARLATPQGALDYSKSANSIEKHQLAIKYLETAKKKLIDTDKNYQSNLNLINQAIAKHNQALQQAGVQSQNLARNHRNLMDISGQLQRQLALLFSVSQIEGYISKVAQVRGVFEMQQRSLEAILQNKSKADEIFNKTVQLAVKSPFQIKELVTYTKQLAAYRIESDKLYDTTKRLADVSAGLGVDMQRLILAYGQVKAAAYLRGTEVRQFTEAGINLYGELQRYFQEVKGEAYTTAQIVDMISKRKVTFEDIENIFQRLTDSGGLFYNMQEIQAETLQGKINNLKDSIDVMLNSIGKANEGTLKGAIDTVKVLIDNWETVVNVAKAFAPVIASMGIAAWANKLKGVYHGLDLMSIGFMKARKAGIAFGTTFKASLPLMAITAAIGVVAELILKIREYNKVIAESTNKYFEAKIRIPTLKDESESNIKKALEKLVQEMNNEGFEIKIKAGISEKEAKEEFKNYLDEYETFLNEQRLMEARYARNKAKWLVDDIDEDSKDYSSSVGEFILQGEELKTVMMQLATEENNLSSEHKKTLEELSKGPKEGEDILSYTKRMKDEIAKMWPALNEVFNNSTVNGAFTKEAMNARSSLTELFKLSKNYIDDEREMISELEDRFGKFDKSMDKTAKKRLKILIDKSDLDAVTKELAYKHYKINVKADKEDAKKEALTLRDQLQAEFDRNKITIKVDYATSKQGVIDYWMDGQEQMQKTADVLKNQLEYVRSHPDQYYLGGELQKQGFDLSGIKTKRGTAADANTYIDSARVEAEIQKRLEALAKFNITPKTTGANRDIWSERISVLKEMQSRYEKLNQLMGENAAIEQTRSAFKPALEFTGMGNMNILPTKEGMVKAYEELLKGVADSKKITEIKKIIAELKIEIQQDELKEQLEKTKKNIEDMFNGLDLHQKLKDAGLSEAEVQALFPGLAKTLDEVEKGIRAEYEAKRDDNGQLSKTDQKDYDDALNKLNQQRVKESQDLVVELTKSYKTQLSDQLQLDRWYYEEKANIAKANLTDEQKMQYEANLSKQYGQKTDENTWKQFQKSNMYISLFENLESSSTRMLKAMSDKLASLRENLKDLPADQLKAIVKQQEKIDELIAGKNPFSGLISGAKEYIGFLKQRKELEEKNIIANNAVAYYTKQRDEQSKIVQSKKQEYDKAVEIYGVDSMQAVQLRIQWMVEKSKLDVILAQLVAEGEITEETAEQIRNGQKLGKTLSDKFNKVGSNLSEFSSALPQIAGDLENVFGTMSAGTKDTIDSISEIAGGLGQTASGIGRAIANPADIGGYIQAIGGIAKTIGAVFAIGDKKKEREIQRQIKNVERLQNAYDVLKEKMDLAWNAVSFSDMNKQTLQNVDAQIASYKSMINSEEAKKKTDRGRIDEWNKAIKELEKTKEELKKQAIEEMGGITEGNYKDAAQAFADAWVDAFNESEDGLKALQETFDDYITNLIKKQAMMRLVQARMKSVFEAIDKSVTEGSDGGINLTKEELANIQSMGETALSGLNKDLQNLMETLGYKGTGKAELSALTQSIQGITEREAEVLESLLNSIRFFVSQQTTDISAIRALLDARYGLETSEGGSNPMLVELRAQTGYLKELRDYIGGVFTYSSSSKGAGLRVYMQ